MGECMNTPLISVVMPTHNRERFLESAIQSVLNQTEKSFEFIIVDDASSDGTPEKLQLLMKTDHRIKILRNSNSLGGGGARNIGVAASSGKWIAFLDDDDEWGPTKLREQLDKLNDNPSAVACSCDFEQRFSSGKTKIIKLRDNVSLQNILMGSVLGGASMCICSKQVFDRIGGFDAKFKSGQDWDLWVKLRQEGEVVVVNKVLVNYEAHDGSRITNNMQSQYLGARRFYFKYRHLMKLSIRHFRVSYSCYIMSRQSERSLNSRFRYLRISLRYAPIKTGISYAISSFPRLIIDIVRLKKKTSC